MLPTVVERARKRALDGKDEGVNRTNTGAISGSLTLEEEYHGGSGEETQEGGNAAMNSQLCQELLEENQFGSSILPTATLTHERYLFLESTRFYTIFWLLIR